MKWVDLEELLENASKPGKRDTNNIDEGFFCSLCKKWSLFSSPHFSKPEDPLQKLVLKATLNRSAISEDKVDELFLLDNFTICSVHVNVEELPVKSAEKLSPEMEVKPKKKKIVKETKEKRKNVKRKNVDRNTGNRFYCCVCEDVRVGRTVEIPDSYEKLCGIRKAMMENGCTLQQLTNVVDVNEGRMMCAAHLCPIAALTTAARRSRRPSVSDSIDPSPSQSTSSSSSPSPSIEKCEVPNVNHLPINVERLNSTKPREVPRPSRCLLCNRILSEKNRFVVPKINSREWKLLRFCLSMCYPLKIVHIFNILKNNKGATCRTHIPSEYFTKLVKSRKSAKLRRERSASIIVADDEDEDEDDPLPFLTSQIYPPLITVRHTPTPTPVSAPVSDVNPDEQIEVDKSDTVMDDIDTPDQLVKEEEIGEGIEEEIEIGQEEEVNGEEGEEDDEGDNEEEEIDIVNIDEDCEKHLEWTIHSA